MAKNRSVVISFDDELQKKLQKLGRETDQILGAAMEAGAEAALPIVRQNLESAIGNTKEKSRSTGELVASLGVSPALVDNEGNTNVKIGFNEPRRVQTVAKGKRSYYTATNAMIANVLEYGKHGQPARPWLKRSKSRSTKVFEQKAQEVLDREVEKL